MSEPVKDVKEEKKDEKQDDKAAELTKYKVCLSLTSLNLHSLLLL